MLKELRRPRPLHVVLVYDALEWLPFQLNIDSHLNKLADEVQNGTYLAARPEIVRAAKSLGLTRPLAFLGIRDALLYRNIVAIAENDLLGEMQPFTRFGRADDQGGDQRFDPDSGWFRAWLKRNAQLWTITENHDWIVETDISNFFPSIHLDSVLDHLIAHSRIGVDVARLLSHMLRQYGRPACGDHCEASVQALLCGRPRRGSSGRLPRGLDLPHQSFLPKPLLPCDR